MTKTEQTSPDESGPAKNATSLWAELGPAVSFILTYTLMGRFLPEGEGPFSRDTAIFWATGALMATTAFVIVTRLMQGKRIPPMLIVSGSIVGFFGVLTIAMQQEAFAYVKPTIINSLFAIAIFGGLAVGRNVWEMMLDHVFDLPRFAWDTLAIRWGLYFVFLAILNEFLWRYFCPVPETPLSLFGLTVAPTEPYTFLGIEFGARDQEHIWAWMKIGNIVITMAFMLANLPYTMKHWHQDDAEAPAE